VAEYQDITGIKIAQAAMTTDFVVVYTSPTDTRTYVKDIMIANTTGSGGSSIDVSVNIVSQGEVTGTASAIIADYSIAKQDYLHWSGLQILNPNDTIEVKGSATGCTVTISGGQAV
jgi:hypothetical protein